MKLDDLAQSVPQLLLSVLKILRGTVCLVVSNRPRMDLAVYNR